MQISYFLPKLRRYALRLANGDDGKADDIYGESLFRFSRALISSQVKLPVTFSYLKRIMFNTFCDIYSFEKRREALYGEEYWRFLGYSVPGPERAYEARERVEDFLEKIQGFEGIRKRILYLLIFQGMNHNEIAEALGVPRATVSTHIHRAREKIKGADLRKRRDLK